MHHWDVLATFHRDVVGCFVWDLFKTSWRRNDGASLLRPFETSLWRSDKTSWRRTAETSWRHSVETSLGVSFETYLPRCRDIQRDVAATSPRRLNAGWDHSLFCLIRCLMTTCWGQIRYPMHAGCNTFTTSSSSPVNAGISDSLIWHFFLF